MIILMINLGLPKSELTTCLVNCNWENIWSSVFIVFLSYGIHPEWHKLTKIIMDTVLRGHEFLLHFYGHIQKPNPMWSNPRN